MTSSALRYFDLGSPGTAYVRDHLTGINPFCSALLDVVIQAPAEVSVLAPVDATTERLLRFNAGGLLPENLDRSRAISLGEGQGVMMPVQSLLDEQVDLLRATLRASPGSACIVDDINPRWADINDNEYFPAAFAVVDLVYHLLTPASDVVVMADAVQGGNTFWHGVAAICAEPPVIDASRQSTELELQKSARSVLMLTCVAYDGEGFVIWRRSKL